MRHDTHTVTPAHLAVRKLLYVFHELLRLQTSSCSIVPSIMSAGRSLTIQSSQFATRTWGSYRSTLHKCNILRHCGRRISMYWTYQHTRCTLEGAGARSLRRWSNMNSSCTWVVPTLTTTSTTPYPTRHTYATQWYTLQLRSIFAATLPTYHPTDVCLCRRNLQNRQAGRVWQAAVKAAGRQRFHLLPRRAVKNAKSRHVVTRYACCQCPQVQ